MFLFLTFSESKDSKFCHLNYKKMRRFFTEKSQCKNPGMAGYEVTVSKQLLRDAHDVIAQFIKERPDITLDINGINLIYRQ